MLMPDKITSARFDTHAIAASFPDHADSLLLDHYMTDEPEASTRLFRVYRPTPAHFHKLSNEHLYVLSGRGTFWMGSPESEAEFGPGTFLVFKKNVVHALPKILEGPVVFLAIDTPRRNPTDIHFVNPQDGTPQSFIQKVSY